MGFCYHCMVFMASVEIDAIDGPLAKSVTIPNDHNSFDFAWRQEGRFNNGTQFIAADTVFAFNLLKKDDDQHLLVSFTYLK